MKRYVYIILLLIIALSTFNGKAAKKPFYDSKSWIVNVAGNSSFLRNNGFESKVNPVDLYLPTSLYYDLPKFNKKNCIRMAEEMTNSGVGRDFISRICGFGSNDRFLKELALKNANIFDREFASEHIRGINDEEIERLIAEDYEPILGHNYIVLTKDVTKAGKNIEKHGHDIEYAIFKVDVTKEEAFDIVMSLGTGRYPFKNYPVEFLYKGKYNSKKPWKAETAISRNVPGLAVRGVLIRRNPARISMGEDKGMKKGDLVSIYSQRSDKKGNLYSKRISRGRICGVWDNEAQINFEAGTAGNRKNGDIVVRTPDKLNRWGLMATYMPHVWGADIKFDKKVGFTRAGLIHHFISDIGFCVTDKNGEKFSVVDGNHEGHGYNAPFFFNAGLGYGISKTFLGFLDVMPFISAQYEAGIMSDFKGIYNNFNDITSDIGSGDLDNIVGVLDDRDYNNLIWSSSVRLPLGVRVGCNLGYPVRLSLELGYAFRFGFGNNYKIVNQTLNLLGAKRDGVFVNLGFIF